MTFAALSCAGAGAQAWDIHYQVVNNVNGTKITDVIEEPNFTYNLPDCEKGCTDVFLIQRVPNDKSSEELPSMWVNVEGFKTLKCDGTQKDVQQKPNVTVSLTLSGSQMDPQCEMTISQDSSIQKNQ